MKIFRVWDCELIEADEEPFTDQDERTEVVTLEEYRSLERQHEELRDTLPRHDRMFATVRAERDALMRHVEDLKSLLTEERTVKLRIKHE